MPQRRVHIADDRLRFSAKPDPGDPLRISPAGPSWMTGLRRPIWTPLWRVPAISRRSRATAPRRAEDHRGDPVTAGVREDSHSTGIAGTGTAQGASPRPGAASGL